MSTAAPARTVEVDRNGLEEQLSDFTLSLISAHLLPDAVLDGAPDLYLANILENDQTTNILYFQVFFSRGLRLLASLPCTLVC